MKRFEFIQSGIAATAVLAMPKFPLSRYMSRYMIDVLGENGKVMETIPNVVADGKVVTGTFSCLRASTVHGLRLRDTKLRAECLKTFPGVYLSAQDSLAITFNLDG